MQFPSGNTAVFAVLDGELAAVISIADKIRLEAKDAIAAMRRRGVKKFFFVKNQATASSRLFFTNSSKRFYVSSS